jgi:hypothetical protein
MKRGNGILEGATWPGIVAGLLSAAALAWRGKVENASVSAPINAPSHWIWGERAVWRNRPSMRFTLTGFAIHQLASVFWGVVYARTAPPAVARAAAAAPALQHAMAVSSLAAGVTALAAAVDLAVVPDRLTPGFQRRLSTRSLWYVYGAFALGLTIGELLQPPSKRLPDGSESG